MAVPDGSWRDRAACTGHLTRLFYATDDDVQNVAKSICRRCPVRVECLDAALDLGDKHGIWGGLTADERKSLKRRQYKAAARAAV